MGVYLKEYKLSVSVIVHKVIQDKIGYTGVKDIETVHASMSSKAVIERTELVGVL